MKGNYPKDPECRSVVNPTKQKYISVRELNTLRRMACFPPQRPTPLTSTRNFLPPDRSARQLLQILSWTSSGAFKLTRKTMNRVIFHFTNKVPSLFLDFPGKNSFAVSLYPSKNNSFLPYLFPQFFLYIPPSFYSDWLTNVSELSHFTFEWHLCEPVSISYNICNIEEQVHKCLKY